MENKKIYKKAIETYGEHSQITMVFEEMSELQKELCKYLRGLGVIENIAGEIADVEIMLDQMKLLFNIENEVKDFKQQKIKRLENNLSS